MKSVLAWLVCLLLLAGPAGAAPVPAFTGLVVDETGTLSEADAAALLERLTALQNSGRAQAAILVARRTHGEALADYALQVAQAWQVGRSGKDDGLLIVVVPSIPAARIEVGYGLEGPIPDLRASQWIHDLLLPALARGELATGLNRLLDEVEAALPPAPAAAEPEGLLDQHPEWKVPFVIALFSVFALFPLFFGAWGAFVSAPLYAAMWGFAAWDLWASPQAASAVAALAFVLPPLWNLNREHHRPLPRALAFARGIANGIAVLLMFGVLVLFISVGVSHVPETAWAGPLFAGALSLGLAAVLFPAVSRPIGVVLRSYMHFLLALAFAYPTFSGLADQPVALSFTVSGAFAGLIALALYVEARRGVTRGSLALIGLALLVMLPVAVLMLVQAVLGSDFQTQLLQALGGGGSIAALLWWAARHGFLAVLRVGLGGRFGGGGAEGRG